MVVLCASVTVMDADKGQMRYTPILKSSLAHLKLCLNITDPNVGLSDMLGLLLTSIVA